MMRNVNLLQLFSFVLSAVATGTKFVGIADVPYNFEQALRLKQQIKKEIPGDSEFLIHLGDIRSAATGDRCTLLAYKSVAAILRLSKVPVFVILGDNDWNDCPNPDEAKNFWESVFVGFEKYWPPKFIVTRQPGYPHNFSFINKNTLFIGLNLVGGRVLDPTEWNTRLVAQATWSIELIRNFYHEAKSWKLDKAASVVIFGHADPTSDHDSFFDPVSDFIDNEMSNRLPIMYVNGDAHVWESTKNFYQQSSFLRITLSGEALEPPTVFTINTTMARTTSRSTGQVFLYDRQLGCQYCGYRSGVVVHKYFPNGTCLELCVADKKYWESMGFGCGNCTASEIDLEPW